MKYVRWANLIIDIFALPFIFLNLFGYIKTPLSGHWYLQVLTGMYFINAFLYHKNKVLRKGGV